MGNSIILLLGLRCISPSAAQVLIQLAPMMLLAGTVLLYEEPFSKSLVGYCCFAEALAHWEASQVSAVVEQLR